MWIAIRPFRYRGQKFNAGDTVPAESWPGRRALEMRRKIRKEVPAETEVTSAQLKKMTRAELNAYASKIGIEDPESFPNRDSLIEAIDGDGMENERTNDENGDEETDDSEETLESNDSGDEDLEDSDSEEDSDDEDEDQ